MNLLNWVLAIFVFLYIYFFSSVKIEFKNKTYELKNIILIIWLLVVIWYNMIEK